MVKFWLCVWCIAAVALSPARAQAPATERPFSIIKMDPALDAIIAPDARLETLGEHFGLTEGPVWVQEGRSGYLLFSDMTSNVIYKWARGAPLSVFLERSGYTGAEPLGLTVGQQTKRGRVHVFLVGSNGLSLDPQGRLLIAAMADRKITRLEKDGTRTVLAERYDGKRFNGPNDLVLKSNGSLYFTDSPSGLRNPAKTPDRELPYNGLFLVKDGNVTLLDKDPQGGFPNGIALSPEEKYLYVSAGRATLRYEVQPDDTIRNATVFIDAGSDGMKVDLAGNLYTTSGGVRITSPEGKHIGTLQMPIVLSEPRPQICATSVAFGDADGKGLYVTGCTHLFRVQLKVAGVRAGFPISNNAK